MKKLLERTALPEGFRDFGPEAAQAIANLTVRLDALYSRWGYRRVLTPTLEAEDVLGPALGPKAFAGAFRMVDPLTGQRLVYRPDITPQVARLVATGAAGESPPYKLFYRGAVVRRRATGGAGAREIYQSGVESFGSEPAAGDAEIVALAVEVARESGLGGAVLELGDVRFVEGILAELKITDETRAALARAIDQKARADIETIIEDHGAGIADQERAVLEALPDLFGSPETLETARKFDLPPLSQQALDSLARLLDALDQAGALPERVSIDLAEVRGLDYYTGLLFGLFAPQTSVAVLRGGRYDRLAGNFGRDMPAVGFATDLELLARTPSAAGRAEHIAMPDVLVFDGQGDTGRLLKYAAALRSEGKRVVTFTAPVALGQLAEAARAWAEARGITSIVDSSATTKEAH